MFIIEVMGCELTVKIKIHFQLQGTAIPVITWYLPKCVHQCEQAGTTIFV